MTSPAAAAMAALVRQYYTDGFYPTGAAVTANRIAPTAALVKATMLNSTQVMTGTGTGPVPNNCQGWGRVLLDNALFFAGQARTLFATDDPGFAQGAAGQTKTFTLQVAAGQPLRVTLAWTDFPSTPAASVNLNNDLDLVVSGPSGTFLGNVFAASQSTTGGTADRRNNVEQVALSAPAAGSYTITVRASTCRARRSGSRWSRRARSAPATRRRSCSAMTSRPTRAGSSTPPPPTPRPPGAGSAPSRRPRPAPAPSSSGPPTAAPTIW